jgi:hypothetical protein
VASLSCAFLCGLRTTRSARPGGLVRWSVGARTAERAEPPLLLGPDGDRMLGSHAPVLDYAHVVTYPVPRSLASAAISSRPPSPGPCSPSPCWDASRCSAEGSPSSSPGSPPCSTLHARGQDLVPGPARAWPAELRLRGDARLRSCRARRIQGNHQMRPTGDGHPNDITAPPGRSSAGLRSRARSSGTRAVAVELRRQRRVLVGSVNPGLKRRSLSPVTNRPDRRSSSSPRARSRSR